MTDPILIETAERAFKETATSVALAEAEATGWAEKMWNVAAGIGLPWISVPEEFGGPGGSISDAVAVLQIAGSYAVPLPLAETGMLAGWLLSAAGMHIAEDVTTVVPPTATANLEMRAGRLWGEAKRVPWARAAHRLVALLDRQIVVVPASAYATEPVMNLAGEPRDTVIFAGATPEAVVTAPEGVSSDALWARGALSRAALMSGALSAAADMTVRYTGERRQFGTPIGRFQAVQAYVVISAEEAALVDLATRVAAREADRGPALFEISAAKILADQAARTVPRAVHQAHGAMGVTREYPLHHLSRRLWSWRAEYGGAAVARRLGRAVAGVPADRLYRVVANGTASGICV